jgi:hypothetical protein
MPSEQLEPVEVVEGKSAIVLAGNQFGRISGSAPYSEILIAVAVQLKATGDAPGIDGFYPIYLPVTTEDARWYGVDALGMPKFIADIDFEESGDRRCCRLAVDGQDVLSLEVPIIETVEDSWDMSVYGVVNDHILRTDFRTTGQRGMAVGQAGASFTLGPHPIAESLRQLEISALPLDYGYSHGLQSVLERPVICSPV